MQAITRMVPRMSAAVSLTIDPSYHGGDELFTGKVDNFLPGRELSTFPLRPHIRAEKGSPPASQESMSWRAWRSNIFPSQFLQMNITGAPAW